MPSFCAAVGCKSRHQKGRDVSFHSPLPSSPTFAHPCCERSACSGHDVAPACHLSQHELSLPHRKPELMWQWLLAMGRADMKPNIHHKICSKHFEKSCFFAGLDRPCLRPNAVPTLFSCAQPKTKTLARKPLQVSRARSSPYRSEEPYIMTALDGTLASSSSNVSQSVLKSRVVSGGKSVTSGKALPEGRALPADRKAQGHVTADKSLPKSMKLLTRSRTVNTRKMANKTGKNSTQLLVSNTTESQRVAMPARKITVKCQLAANGELAVCSNSIARAKLAKRLPVRNVTNEGTAIVSTDSDGSVLDDRPRRSLLLKRGTELSDCMPLKKRPFQNGNITPREPLERNPTAPCSGLASPNSVPLAGAPGGSHCTVNRLLDTGSSQPATTAAEALFLHTYCGDETTSPDLSKAARALQDTRQRLYTANRKLRRKDQTLCQQQTTIDELQKQVSLLKRASEGFRVSERLPVDLIRDWHENVSRVPHARRYRPMTLEFAAGLYARSAHAYKFLSDWLPMPSMQLMRKHKVGTVAPNVSEAPSDNLESFNDETVASETQQALAALDTTPSVGSVFHVELLEQDGTLLSPQET